MLYFLVGPDQINILTKAIPQSGRRLKGGSKTTSMEIIQVEKAQCRRIHFRT